MPYIGNTPTTQSFTSGTDYFNGTGSATVFTLNRPVVSINDIQVVVNNVVQAPNSGYSISGNTLTFDAAPSAGTNNVYVRYLTTTTQVIAPSTNSVSYASLTPDMQQDIGISFKNRIINGDMRIDQRTNGALATGGIGGIYNSVDRWQFHEATDATVTLQRVSDAPAGFSNSVRFTVTTADSSFAAGEYCFYRQAIEGFNVADFSLGTANAQPITISFFVKSSLTGTFSGSLQNSAENRGYAFTYAISAANTWERKTVTIPGDITGTWLTDNGIGLSLAFSLGLGSTYSSTANTWASSTTFGTVDSVRVVSTLNATFQLTGVQLEKGTTATAFDNRAYGTELHLCQRYYEQQDMTANGNDRPFAVGGAYLSGSNVISQQCLFFKLLKRATPTVTFSAAGTFSQHAPGAFRNNLTSIVLTNATPTGLQIMCTSGNGGGSPSVQSVCAILEPSSAGGTASIGISAEL